MSFSFNASHIAASGVGNQVSAIRWLVSDITEPSEVSDEIIVALYAATEASLSQTTRVYTAAYQVAEYLYKDYSKKASFSSGGTSINYADLAQRWHKVLQTLGETLQTLTTRNTMNVVYARRSSLWSE